MVRRIVSHLLLPVLLLFSVVLCEAKDRKQSAAGPRKVLVLAERGGLHEGFTAAGLQWLERQKERFNMKLTVLNSAKEIGKGERYVRDAEIYANGVEAADEVAPGIKNEILFGKLKCKDKDVMAIARAAPEQREDLVRKLQFPSARAAPGSPVISSPGEEDEVPDEEPAAPAEDTIEDVMYELNDALESMIFRWNFCFETHDAIYRQKANQKRIRLLAKEGINYLKNIGGFALVCREKPSVVS